MTLGKMTKVELLELLLWKHGSDGSLCERCLLRVPERNVEMGDAMTLFCQAFLFFSFLFFSFLGCHFYILLAK